MPRFLSLLLSLLVLLIIPHLVSAQTILVLGDSLSAAYNMPTEQGWVALLDKRLDEAPGSHQVINASIAGDTTSGGLARFPQALQSHQPDIVILALGTNDGLRALGLSSIKENLAKIIELTESQGGQVLLAGMQLPPNYGPFYNNKFSAIYRDLASSYEVSLIPFLLDQVGGVNELTQTDGLHPNAKAQPLILDNIWPHLQNLLEPQ